MRTFAVVIAIGSALALAGCDGGDASPTLTPQRTATAAAPTRTASPSAPTATAPAAIRTPESTTTPTPQPSGESGIDGTVTIGPTCPVERIESPCPDRPYEASIAVLDAAGRKVAEARSDADGRFHLALPPGVYRLVPQSAGTPPTAQEQTATVAAGGFTAVEIAYDSGIR